MRQQTMDSGRLAATYQSQKTADLMTLLRERRNSQLNPTPEKNKDAAEDLGATLNIQKIPTVSPLNDIKETISRQSTDKNEAE